MRTGGRTGLKKKGKKGIGSKSLEKKKLECYIYILKKKLYKSNWLVVSAWSNTTKVAGSNPADFCKKMIRFFFSVFSTRVPRSIPQVFIKIFFVPISHNYYI